MTVCLCIGIEVNYKMENMILVIEIILHSYRPC